MRKGSITQVLDEETQLSENQSSNSIIKEGGIKEDEIDFSKASDFEIHEALKKEFWK
jgi:hypothetical protein